MPPRFLPKYATSVQPLPPREASGYRGYQGYDTSARAQPQSVAEILSSPLGEVTPDLGRLTGEAGRKREIADMLMQGAMQQDNTSIAGGLSSLGQAWLARGADKKATAAEEKQRTVSQELLQAAMQGGESGKASLMQLLSGNQDAAMQYAIQANTPKPKRDPLVVNGRVLDPENPQTPLADYSDPVKADTPDYAYEVVGTDLVAINKSDPTDRMVVGPAPSKGNGITIGPDGTIQIGGPAGGSVFGNAGDRTGASAFGGALESASTADATLALANQARAIIDGGYNSGALANIKGQTGRVLNEFGLGDTENTADYEQFTAVNNQLAAQMLKLFGGSDTERELAISMASNIGPTFSEATNKRMLDALEKTVATQRQKPEFIAQWTRRHGSLDAISPETGLGFQATWDNYLQQQSGLYANAANDTAQVGMEDAAKGLLPEDKARRLQELRAKQAAGNLQ